MVLSFDIMAEVIFSVKFGIFMNKNPIKTVTV